MPRVSAAFFALGAVLLFVGMGLGEYMGANEDFVYAPVHAHLNLLGWVTLALFGTFYALTKDTYSPRLAWINFILSGGGILAMAPMLFIMLKTGDNATWGPRLGMAGAVAILGLVVFLVSALREVMRRRA